MVEICIMQAKKKFIYSWGGNFVFSFFYYKYSLISKEEKKDTNPVCF